MIVLGRHVLVKFSCGTRVRYSPPWSPGNGKVGTVAPDYRPNKMWRHVKFDDGQQYPCWIGHLAKV